MIDRETASLIFGLVITAAAVYLGVAGVIDSSSVVTLILVGVAVAGFGRFRSKNFETVLSRALRAGLKVEPVICRDDREKKITVYTKGGQVPEGLKKLIGKLAKVTGYEVEWRQHGGLQLLDSRLIDEVHDFHGPQYSGKWVEYIAGRGPKLWHLTLWHEKFHEPRVTVYLAKAGGGNVWELDFILKQTKEIVIPIPADDEYKVIINLVAFAGTPSSIGYKIVEHDVSLPDGDSFAFTIFENRLYRWPQRLVYGAKEAKRRLVFSNVSSGKVLVSVTYFWRGYWKAHRELRLEPESTGSLPLEPLEIAEVSVSAEAPGYLVVKAEEVKEEAPAPEAPEALVVMSGDEIRPDEHSWVGSLGYYAHGYLLTNAHVTPYAGEVVYHTRSGRKIGTVAKVAKVRTVTFLDIALNFLFGKKLPLNKVDAAAISPEHYVQYQKFRRYAGGPAGVSPGDRVYSRGRTSGERSGVVRDTNVTVAVPWPHGGGFALFTDCILVEMPTRPGDSGSAVVTDHGVVGLVFAGDQSGQIGLVIKARNIEEWLGSAR